MGFSRSMKVRDRSAEKKPSPRDSTETDRFRLWFGPPVLTELIIRRMNR
jgi:hypothetical protein